MDKTFENNDNKIKVLYDFYRVNKKIDIFKNEKW